MSPRGQVSLGWRNLFLGFDKLLKLWKNNDSMALRRQAIQQEQDAETASFPSVRRGVDYLIRSQDQDGSWHGCRGANYIYETFLALRDLHTAGEDEREAHMLRAGEWLRSIQNADGGWGESCSNHGQNTFVPAESTASRTAWAILGLLASGDSRSLSVVQGVEYLRKTRLDDGSWNDGQGTGTGFPLLALSAFQEARGAGIAEEA